MLVNVGQHLHVPPAIGRENDDPVCCWVGLFRVEFLASIRTANMIAPASAAQRMPSSTLLTVKNASASVFFIFSTLRIQISEHVQSLLANYALRDISTRNRNSLAFEHFVAALPTLTIRFHARNIAYFNPASAPLAQSISCCRRTRSPTRPSKCTKAR